jgi:aminomethyltransferase
MRRTPLYEAHQRLGARLIEFGGWEMPVHYTSIVDEHLCVRKASGIFDISHMGEVLVEGALAEAFLNELLTNDISKLAVGLGQYTIMCNEQGGAIDDLYVYRLEAQRYLLIINAARIEEDVAWIQRRAVDYADLSVLDESDQFLDDCVSGPATGGMNVTKPTELQKNEIARFRMEGGDAWISRTGYTGEDGFEIVAASDAIKLVWSTVLAKGHVGCLQPCGLGARDTLRTEVCYPLYGHELTASISPIEAGIGFFVCLDKQNFVGRDVLAKQKTEKPSRRCVAFKMIGKSAPPRPNYPIRLPGDDGAIVGEVTSGTQSPSLGLGIGLGLIATEHAKIGSRIDIEIRGRRCSAEIVKKPIYQKPTS